MRLILKGGVWKNSEDEILKAAVMKYGLNQWSRVASLLPRKTPKQCKARWQEWLDPTVKKTEWTREEEERLLHLAKLMPAQWRTIAPLVGRTPAQCIEHYEKLLDAAQGAEAAEKKDDPRRLRPGEIDPQPEVKPARPDPVDMDEDEKEMLSEARARLANTQGKKAKRKVRERMLEEAKRLAQLQKLRELKAAGINVDARKKRRKNEGIDYANEIPFEKRAPAGFFDTGDEDVRYITDKAAETAEFKTTLLNKIEGERASAKEARLKAEDKRKMKQLAGSDLPAMLQAEADKDPMNLRKRAPLMMPAPSVTDSELEDIARLGAQAGAAGVLGGGLSTLNGDDGRSTMTGLTAITAGLLGRYGGAPEDIEGSVVALAASRRAGTVPTRDAIMEEARNQAAAAAATTSSLFGGDNRALEEGTGYAGAMPQSRRLGTGAYRSALGAGVGLGATPMFGGSVMLQGETPVFGDRMGPGHGGASAAGPTPGSVMTGLGSVAKSLRLRDEMGLNRFGLGQPVGDEDVGQDRDGAASEVYPGDSASVAGGAGGFAGDEKAFVRQLSQGVLAGLAALPKPRNAYELVVPEVVDEEAIEGPSMAGASYGAAAAALRGADLGSSMEHEDAEEEASRVAAALEVTRQAELARRSSALRHVGPALPRPLALDDEAIAPAVGTAGRSGDATAREHALAGAMVQEEMLKLLKRDAVQYPILHKFARAPKRAPMVDEVSDEDLSHARHLLHQEQEDLGMGKAIFEEYVAAAAASLASHIYLPSSRELVSRHTAPEAELNSALKLRFEGYKVAWEREQARLGKVEARMVTLTRGYETRAGKLAEELASVMQACRDKNIEIACLTRLAADEAAALPVRLARAQALLQEEVERERVLQARYAAAVRELDALGAKTAALA